MLAHGHLKLNHSYSRLIELPQAARLVLLVIPILGPPHHLRSHSVCHWKMSSLRGRYRGLSFGNLLKERLTWR
jgi:hypothetical protein